MTRKKRERKKRKDRRNWLRKRKRNDKKEIEEDETEKIFPYALSLYIYFSVVVKMLSVGWESGERAREKVQGLTCNIWTVHNTLTPHQSPLPFPLLHPPLFTSCFHTLPLSSSIAVVIIIIHPLFFPFIYFILTPPPPFFSLNHHHHHHYSISLTFTFPSSPLLLTLLPPLPSPYSLDVPEK